MNRMLLCGIPDKNAFIQIESWKNSIQTYTVEYLMFFVKSVNAMKSKEILTKYFPD